MIKIITCKKHTPNCIKFQSLAYELAQEYDFENLYFLGAPEKEIKRYGKNYLLITHLEKPTTSYPLNYPLPSKSIKYLLPKPKYKNIVYVLNDLYNPTVLFVAVDYLIASASGIKIILTQKTKDPKAFVEKMFEVFGYSNAVCISRSVYSKSIVYLPNNYFYNKEKVLRDRQAFRDYLLEKIQFVRKKPK